MNLKSYIDEIETFLKDYLPTAHANGYVLGLSGGVDSSLCAALVKNAVGKENLIGVMIPIDSQEADLKDATSLAETLNLNYRVIDASDIYHNYVETFKKANAIENISQGTSANLKARIRMSILYAIAQQNNYLVVGTDNADERYTGYFTKFGDGACDLLPIAHLLKKEVVEASKILGIPNFLADRIPSAGLFEGQTDEKEMGVTYKDLDDFLSGKEISPQAKEKITYLHRISEHKRTPIPTPKPFERD